MVVEEMEEEVVVARLAEVAGAPLAAQAVAVAEAMAEAVAVADAEVEQN